MSDRTFRLILDGKKGGLVKGSTPSSAAKKAYKKLSAENGKSSFNFELQETTKDSKKKVYGPYKGCLEKDKIKVKIACVIPTEKPHKYTLKGGFCFPQGAANYVISCHASSYGLDPNLSENWTNENQNRTLVSYINYGEILSNDCAWAIWATLLGIKSDNYSSNYMDNVNCSNNMMNNNYQEFNNNSSNCMDNVNCSNQMLNLYIWVDKSKKSDLWGIYDCTNPDKHQILQKWTSKNSSSNKGYRLQHALNDIHNDWRKKYSRQYYHYNVHILACG